VVLLSPMLLCSWSLLMLPIKTGSMPTGGPVEVHVQVAYTISLVRWASAGSDRGVDGNKKAGPRETHTRTSMAAVVLSPGWCAGTATSVCAPLEGVSGVGGAAVRAHAPSQRAR